MIMDTTAIYWLTFSEIQELYNKVIKEIETSDNSEFLNRILLEINVAVPREKNSILPSEFIASIMDLPKKSIPLRFTLEEISVIKNMNISTALKERFQ